MGMGVVVVSGVLALLAVAIAGLNVIENQRLRQTKSQLKESHERFMKQMDAIEGLLAGEEDESIDAPVAVVPFETDYFSPRIYAWRFSCKHHHAGTAEKRWLEDWSHDPRRRSLAVGHSHGKELVAKS